MRFALPFALTLLTLTAAFVEVRAGPVKQRNASGRAIPLVKRSSFLNDDKSVDVEAVKSHVISLRDKILRGFDHYERNTGTVHPAALNTSRPQKRVGAGISLTSARKMFWYGTLTIGTDPKPFNVEIDTGSSDLFVPARICDSTCHGHVLWDLLSATPLKKEFSITFNDGASASGWQYTDKVTIAGFTAHHQAIGAATTYSKELQIENYLPDGMLGMAFQSLSKFEARPLFATLIEERAVTDPVFSLKLTSSGGELFIGGSNKQLYRGSVAFTDVTHPGYWQVSIDKVRFKGKTYLKDVPAIIDTGANVIVGDTDRVSKLYESVGGSTFVGDGFYSFPCNSFPIISFVFGGSSFPISPAALNIGPVSEGSLDCLSGIVALDMGASFWSIGNVFLQGVYTVFDVGFDEPSVGFALLR